VRVNNNEEEAQMKLYSEVQKVFETDTDIQKREIILMINFLKKMMRIRY